MKRNDIVSMAQNCGYVLEQEQQGIGLLIFTAVNDQGPVQVNVYHTTMTVGTSLNHPKQGKTQMFRRGVWAPAKLLAIFKNPRVHGLRGYQTK